MRNLKNKNLRLLSLFSGCGGMDIGFEGGFECFENTINEKINADWIVSNKNGKIKLRETDFQLVFANDIRPDAKAAWVSYFQKYYNNANDLYKLESIVDLVKKAKDDNTIFPNNIDVVIGGFPCQDFSIAGKRLGFDSKKSHTGEKLKYDEPTIENRGQLYIWMKEVISMTKPKLFIAENVKGLTNLGDVKKIIEKDFSNAADGGYLVIPAKVINAADYGVPQSRERVIFYGFKKSALCEKALKELMAEEISNEYDPYPQPTHSYTFNDNKLKAFTKCKDVLLDLDEPNISNDPSQISFSKAKYMGSHCQGQTEIKLNGIAPTIRSEHHGNIEFRRLSKEHGGIIENELKEGKIERRLTIRECARIQTFPDDYQFILKKTNNNVSVSGSDAYKIIGNAVPCLLAYNIAMRIQNKWNMYFI